MRMPWPLAVPPPGQLSDPGAPIQPFSDDAAPDGGIGGLTVGPVESHVFILAPTETHVIEHDVGLVAAVDLQATVTGIAARPDAEMLQQHIVRVDVEPVTFDRDAR